MADRLADKNAIITGGGYGLGLEIARLFGSEGARVAILDCDGASAEKAESELLALGLEAIAFCVDVTDASALAEACRQVAAQFSGVVHILVNNAGIVKFGNIEDTSLTTWERIMAVNVTGTFLTSQTVLPYMKKQGGAIINFASVGGLIGIPKMAAYCTSKAAVIGLTRQMAADWTRLGIRVNCLCPGRVAGTGMDHYIMQLDTLSETQAKLAKYPIGRFGKPEEIAQAALFLASHESSFISGTTLCVDGGMTAV